MTPRLIATWSVARCSTQAITSLTGPLVKPPSASPDETKPDLIILDVHLPDVSGLDVCRQLKADPATAPIPIMHLSASHILSEDKVAGLDSGADAYLTQPVDSRELLATVNSLLRARRAEDALRRIQWLLHRSVSPEPGQQETVDPSADDPTRHNTHRLLLDAVGVPMLRQIAGEYLDLLDTCSAIHEVNGDYALNVSVSSWCRFIDQASRRKCQTGELPSCGKGRCSNSCWRAACLPAIQQRRPIDVECDAGIRMYALPIISGDEVLGCISVGYGDPPRHAQKLAEVAERFGVSVEQLKEHGESYQSRPPFIIDLARKRLHTAARLIAEIVERKRAERRLKEAKEAAETANRAKDHFLAVLSHELRTPLTPALAAVNMLQSDQTITAESRAEALDIIGRNIEMEARLIDDLLDVTRIVRGKVQIDCRPTEIREIIERAIDVCRRDIDARGLSMTIDIDGCGSLLVNADPVRLQQVYWNILKNAMKFTPNGTIKMRCWRDGGSLVTEVADTGEGIDPEILPQIFNAFEQGGSRVTRQFGGLGLGLTITKQLVELHGGTISAQSLGKGQGSTFRVSLPIYLKGLSAGRQNSQALAAEASVVQLRKLRILLVEDHLDTATVMGRVLAASGHEVRTAAHIAGALELARSQDFDLMLSDLGLPDGSGLELLRTIRQMGLDMPAIALSGYGQDADLEQSRLAGFAEHLLKPIDIGRLENAIARVSAGPTRAEPGT